MKFVQNFTFLRAFSVRFDLGLLEKLQLRNKQYKNYKMLKVIRKGNAFHLFHKPWRRTIKEMETRLIFQYHRVLETLLTPDRFYRRDELLHLRAPMRCALMSAQVQVLT